MNNKTLAQQGFAMPAEWDQHDAVFLAWPHDRITFPDHADVERTFIEIIAGLQGSEQVNLFVVDDEMQKHVEKMLNERGLDIRKVMFWQHDYADVWFRDFGPTYVIAKKERVMIKWVFNAWGNKYPSLLKDNDVPLAIQKKKGERMVEPGLIMEGGSLEVNGKGTLLTTEECLLNKNRNPSLSKEQIESKLGSHLGLTKFIWLRKGIKGDDTDAHIDNLARFVNEKTIVCLFEENKKDANYRNLKENHDILTAATDQDGNQFKLIKVPQPHLRGYGRRLPVSYMNFYIANKAVLMPVFGDKNDAEAVEIICALFPTRKVIPIDCSKLISGGGTLHCISQQVPKIK